jgi:hypothetical protein
LFFCPFYLKTWYVYFAKIATRLRPGRNVDPGARRRRPKKVVQRTKEETMKWGNRQTSAVGLVSCSALAILAAASAAKAQTCPTGTAVPHQTIKIFNDTNEYIFAEFEVGLNNPDLWIQMACGITQTQAKTFTYATTVTNRFYINGDKGIAPGGSVVITLPLYTQLAASVDATKANQFAEWWQGENMQIFASETSTPPAAYANSFSGKARPNQMKMLSAATNPSWPTCTNQTGAACLLPSTDFFTDTDGTLPKFGPSQLVEATLGATQVQKVVNDSLPTSLNETQADFDVSYVNVAYIAAAMGPYMNNQAGYVGSPLLISQFQPKLMSFEKQFDWPTFIDLDGTNEPIPKLPSTLELLSRLSGANAPTDLPAVKTWPTDIWPPIQQIRENWANYSSTCTHSAEGFTTFCDAILDVRDLVAANYKNYLKLFENKTCVGTPVEETQDLTVAHVYGWSPWVESAGPGAGCSPTANLLENTPGGYADDGFALYAKVKEEFDKLNYGTYSDAAYNFNPWVQFIHGDAILPDQLGIPGVYAYSVDDAVGNLNVEAQGYIIDIGSTKNLENQMRAAPPVNIALGFEPDAPVNFETYGVCGDASSQQKPVNPANPQFFINAAAPQNCPIFLTDSNKQVYQFKVTTPPPFEMIPTQDLSMAAWSNGKGANKFNTTSIIECSANKSQLSKAWCCSLLPGSGAGVFAYSTPVVPPTPHQLLQNQVVTLKADPFADPDTMMTCNMGN